MLNCASNQSTCDWYANLRYERERGKNCCLNDLNELDLLVSKKTDEKKLEGRFKVRQVLQEYIENLKERLELLMMIMQDLSREYIQTQSQFMNSEELINVQKDIIDKIEKDNQDLELKVNQEIAEIRRNFTNKWKELDLKRQQFEDVQKELHETCRRENELEAELKDKKLEIKSNLCCLKSLQGQLFPQKLTMKMFDKLRRKEGKYLKRFIGDQSTVQCFKQKIGKTQRELQIVHRVTRNKLRTVKLHDEWRLEQLKIRNEELESLKAESSLMFDDSDQVISSLKKNILLMEKDVADSRGTIKSLQCLADTLLAEKSPCKRIIKPSTHGQPKTKKTPAKDTLTTVPVKAEDYMGSTFVKLV